MSEIGHPINVVVQRTGMSAHLIRIWEKRYRAVEPTRTPTNRRLYSDEQIDRLSLLRDLTRSGQSIGFIAKLPTERLRELASTSKPRPALDESASPAALLQACTAAVKAMDARGLEDALSQAEVALGGLGMLQRVAAPLAQSLGDLWQDGTITAAHEHFASSILRTLLGHAARPFAAGANDPVLLVATPPGQLHEIGALLVAAAATHVGWKVTYLGASLPAAELAGAVLQNRARAVALSLVHPMDDPRLETELIRLRSLLPPDVGLIVGGQAMRAYRNVLERIGALQVGELQQLPAVLNALRSPDSATPRRRRPDRNEPAFID